MGSALDPAVLGVLVPCRNEAAVIERKLRNLAALDWPRARRPHRVIVVDDQSSDGTPMLARGQAAGFDGRPARLEVVGNDMRPGKVGAIQAGLRHLGGTVDLLVLTDADVLLESGALCALERAFAADPRLGMACGAQRFVRTLASDGSPRGADGGEPMPAAGLYDQLTARVRQLESRGGRLFSVHGQLLAWRAALELTPTAGFAADDIDLMLQARVAGARIAMAGEARFLEVKPATGPAREAQALRRARAYLQMGSHPCLARAAALGGPLARLQVWAYRRLPLASVWLLPLALALLLLACILLLPPAWALVGGVALLALCSSGPGRRAIALLAVIHGAHKAERAEALSDRWETPRA